MIGQAVVGEVHPDRILTNAGARPGQAVVLTKAIGTGLLATAVKRSDPADIERGGPWAVAYDAAIASMIRSNSRAADVAQLASATAATDITGFGLLGHLQRVASESAVCIQLDADAVPRLPGAESLIEAGFVPGGTMRNLDFLQASVAGGARADWNVLRYLLADPQTSGGLAFFCDPAAADSAVEELRRDGHPAAVIGHVAEAKGRAGTIVVR